MLTRRFECYMHHGFKVTRSPDFTVEQAVTLALLQQE